MDFYEVLDQVVDLLKQRGRVTYSALKRQFGVDDDFLQDLQDEILYVHPVVDDGGRGLIWTGNTEAIQVTTTSPSDQAEPQPVSEPTQTTQVTSPPPQPHAPDAERYNVP